VSCDVGHVDNSRSILNVMCVMWITPSQCPICTICLCGITHMRHAVFRFDFWGYLW